MSVTPPRVREPRPVQLRRMVGAGWVGFEGEVMWASASVMWVRMLRFTLTPFLRHWPRR